MAGTVKLHAHPEFSDAIRAAARASDTDERFVEKDYYVTEVLRIAAQTHPGRTIFKGGTSLSKGWQLTDRFSEDIDLFVDPEAWTPPLGKRRIDRELRKLRDAVAEHPALTYVENEGRTVGGFGREDYFSYESRFDALPGLRAAVLLEPGVQSGRQPTEGVELSSLVGDYLRGDGQADLADDLAPFEMTLLHFRRTFVEKLFTVHGKVERMKNDGVPLGRDARHYADLHALAARSEVEDMLRSDGVRGDQGGLRPAKPRILRRCLSTARGAELPRRDGVFLPPTVREKVEPDYEVECRRLFPGSFPRIDEVLERLEGLRELL